MMKRIYTKPDVIFESFSMTQSIASCNVEANFQKGQCGVRMTENVILFNDQVFDCTFQMQDGEYDGLCYHVPFENYIVFGS